MKDLHKLTFETLEQANNVLRKYLKKQIETIGKYYKDHYKKEINIEEAIKNGEFYLSGKDWTQINVVPFGKIYQDDPEDVEDIVSIMVNNTSYYGH